MSAAVRFKQKAADLEQCVQDTPPVKQQEDGYGKQLLSLTEVATQLSHSTITFTLLLLKQLQDASMLRIFQSPLSPLFSIPVQ